MALDTLPSKGALSGMLSFLTATNVFIIIAVCVGIRLYRQHAALSQFKGPPGVGISKKWLLFDCLWSSKMHLVLWEVNKKYGDVARIGPNHLVTSNPDLIRRMNARKSTWRRSDWYTGARFEPKKDTIITQRDETKHHELRSKMAAGYSGKENDHLDSTIDGRVQELLDLIRNKYLSSRENGYRPMDWGQKSSFFTLDSITDIAFGYPIGAMENDKDPYDFFGLMESALVMGSVMTIYPWLAAFFQTEFMHRLTAPKADDSNGFGRMMGVAKEAVRKRFGPHKVDRRDMLAAFLRHGLTQEEAETESLFQVVAGGDTTATALSATVLYISSNAEIQTKLRRELHEAGLTPKRPTSSVVSNADAKRLPYLQACIKEGLRIYPPIIGLMDKIPGPEGDTLPDGRYIPPETHVGYCAWGLQRNPAIYGEDANVFRPERWLEHKDEEDRWAKEKNLELVFSHGRFTCMGKDIALMEINKCLAELISRFTLSVVDPTHPWDSHAYGIFVTNNLWLRVEETQEVGLPNR